MATPTNEARSGDTAPLKLRKLYLRFADKEAERRFANEYLKQTLPFTRAAILSGTLLYCLFGLLDIYIVPDVLTEVWLIRYAIVSPFLLALLLFTYTRYFHRTAQFTLALGMIVPGLGILAMIALADPPGSYLYYAGLILVVIYCSGLGALRYLYAAALSVALFLLYQIVALYVNPVPGWALINNTFFLAVSVGVSIFWSYTQEFYVRRNFVSTDLLLQEKARSEELLRETRAANHAKSEFLAVVSHELRTPLNAIIGFSEVLRQELFGPLGSARYRSYVDDIHDSGHHLLNIISDILDLTKAEAGKLRVSEKEVDLCETLNRCLRLFRKNAAEQGVRLAFDVPDHAPPLLVDPRLLRQVAINLISNAIKFTQRGGAVIVSVASEESGACCLRVEDTGIGIAEENLAKVVEPFVQVESAFARKHAGTGLGLPLVRKIMELHGGQLEIESKVGVGTKATARFPAARVIREVSRRRVPRRLARAH